MAEWAGKGLWHCGHLPSSLSTLLLQHLEQSLEELNLTSFGLMDTTLEEVFLKVSEEDQSLENSDVGMGAGGRHKVLLGSSEGLCDLAGLGSCRTLLFQVTGFPAEPIPAKDSQPLLHSGFTPTWNSGKLWCPQHTSPEDTTEMLQELEHLCHGARLGELQLFTWRREGSRHLLVPKGYLKK